MYSVQCHSVTLQCHTVLQQLKCTVSQSVTVAVVTKCDVPLPRVSDDARQLSPSWWFLFINGVLDAKKLLKTVIFRMKKTGWGVFEIWDKLQVKIVSEGVPATLYVYEMLTTSWNFCIFAFMKKSPLNFFILKENCMFYLGHVQTHLPRQLFWWGRKTTEWTYERGGLFCCQPDSLIKCFRWRIVKYRFNDEQEHERERRGGKPQTRIGGRLLIRTETSKLAPF